MTTAHEVKCWPESFEAIHGGFKTCEVRKDDRGYRGGDYLLLREWAPGVIAALPPAGRAPFQKYTGRNMMCVITYILREGDAFGSFLAEKDTVILSIQLLARGKDRDAAEATS